jgi:LysR family glycine cleavage system transcriptional activator
MDRRQLPLTALRSFEALGRHLSFSRAAEALGVTHGAVSRQIASLETLLGVKLVERGPTLSLTEEGHRLFAGIAPAFDRLAAAMDSVERVDAERSLAVNAPPTFTMKWLIPRLSGFQRQHPGVDVRLSTGIGPLRELKMNEVDVVIRRMEAADTEVASAAFLSSTLLAVCAPELIERSPIATALDIARHQLIEAETGVVGWADWFVAAGHTLPGRARFARFEHMFFALEAALDGLGVALMPSALVVDDLAAGRLTIAWNVPGVYERDYFHLLSPLSRQTATARAFCAWLSKEGEESNSLADVVIKDDAPNRKRAPGNLESRI